jgi:predicted RNA-binding Zn-ribbon protein involved in translation (DUF1610 family)
MTVINLTVKDKLELTDSEKFICPNCNQERFSGPRCEHCGHEGEIK